MTLEEVAQSEGYALARQLGFQYSGNAALLIPDLRAECRNAMMLGL